VLLLATINNTYTMFKEKIEEGELALSDDFMTVPAEHTKDIPPLAAYIGCRRICER
jgi:hypothetical protein